MASKHKLQSGADAFFFESQDAIRTLNAHVPARLVREQSLEGRTRKKGNSRSNRSEGLGFGAAFRPPRSQALWRSADTWGKVFKVWRLESQ